MGNKGISDKTAKALRSAIDDPASCTKVRQAFKVLDKDGSGCLDRQEWKVFATMILETESQLKTQLGSNSLDDFIGVLFDQVDLNRDGAVSFAEFEKWLTSFQQVGTSVESNSVGPNKSPVFGVKVGELTDGVSVPYFWKALFGFLSQHVDTEGIFRVPGSTEQTNWLKRQFNEGRNVSFSSSSCHDAVGLLKMYLRELPELLIPELFSQQVNPNSANPVGDVHMVVQCLPAPNAMLFSLLISLLKKIVNSKTSLMTPDNIARCIIPTLNCNPLIVSVSISQFDQVFSGRTISFD